MRLYSKLPTPRPREDYNMPEGRGVEEEVGLFLYGLVRITKPTWCIETGTHVGDSAWHIGAALKHNGKGHLITCDINEERIYPAQKRLTYLPVSVIKRKGIDLIMESEKLDFVHIDSGSPGVREEELRMVPDKIAPGGIVCWHDAIVDYTNLYDMFSKLVDWPHIVLPSVVGMAVFQRPE